MADDVASDTLATLERRLRRIEFVTSGGGAEDSPTAGDAKTRLKALEARFSSLQDSSPSARALIQLCMILFVAASYLDAKQVQDTSTPEAFRKSVIDASSSQPTHDQKLAIVQAAADSFKATASNLSQLSGLTVPDASALSPIPALHQRLVNAEAMQNDQAVEIELLRTRTANALAQWYQNMVIGESQQWSEWESRLARVEQVLRRRATATRNEEMV